MENFILRIGCVTINELLSISKEINLNSSEEIVYNNEKLSPKDLLHYVLEELDSTDTKRKNNAILRLFRSIVIKPSLNFLYEQTLDNAFDTKILEDCLEMNLLNELAKNLSFMHNKFMEISK